MASVYISVGSNIQPDRYVRAARKSLQAAFGAVQASPVYRTAAVGFDGDDFLNLVLALHTDAPVERVDEELDRIERSNGRDHAAPRFAPRTLDLDLLMYDDLVIDEEDLRLPRKEILKYAFVLKPLADLAPDLRHPVDGRRFAELLDSLDLGSQRCERIAFDWQE